jgi:hypothetical protein
MPAERLNAWAVIPPGTQGYIALAGIAATLAKGIRQSFKQRGDRAWRDHVEAEATRRILKI